MWAAQSLFDIYKSVTFLCTAQYIQITSVSVGRAPHLSQGWIWASMAFPFELSRTRLNKPSFISWQGHLPPQAWLVVGDGVRTLLASKLPLRTPCHLQGLVTKVIITRCHTRHPTLLSAAITNVVLMDSVTRAAQTAMILFCSVLGLLDVSSFPGKPTRCK